jgi:mono/diheme cytochrome c family protein
VRSRTGLAAATVVLLGLGVPVARAADPVHGKEVYAVRCSPCHGDSGAGDGPAAAAIEPKPRNFKDPGFWRARTRQQLRLVVMNGRPGTLMAPFTGVLSDQEIDDVVAYVESFAPPR